VETEDEILETDYETDGSIDPYVGKMMDETNEGLKQ
jgi:hypothetical protein